MGCTSCLFNRLCCKFQNTYRQQLSRVLRIELLVGAMVTIAPRQGMRRGPFMAFRQRRNRWRSSQLGRYSILKYKPDSKFVHKYKASCVESGPNYFNFTLFFGSFPTERRACSHVEKGAWKKAIYFNLYLLVKRVRFSPYLLVWSARIIDRWTLVYPVCKSDEPSTSTTRSRKSP